MRKVILISCILYLASCILITSTDAKSHSSAGGAYVNQWIAAMMESGKGLNDIITHDFQYAHYSFEFKNRVYKGRKGDLPFFAKKSKPTEIEIEEIRQGFGGERTAILTATADNGLYRSWEIRLLIRPDGIAKVTEIALEGLFEGYPPGCPETVFKRDTEVTLSGNPAGFNGPKTLKLYSFRRDTDCLDYAHPGADEKMLKHCSPKPDTFLVEEEVVVFDQSGQLEAANTVAAKHKGADEEIGKGFKWFSEDGTNFPGRLFKIGGGEEALALTFTAERSRAENRERTDFLKLYIFKGGKWRSIWGFDVGHGTSSGFLGGLADVTEWELRSKTDLEGNPTIEARLTTNEDESYSCPTGTRVVFTKRGSSFKADKKGVPGACFKSWGSGGSLTAYIKEDKGPTYHGPVQEIDWRFQR